MDEVATVLGVSRPRAVVYINDCLDVLSSMAATHVVLPEASEVESVEAGFFAVAGFPGVVGAVDGTLIAIPCPHDFEGWYCRKGFPAVNVQAVVDHRGAFAPFLFDLVPTTTSRCGMDLALEIGKLRFFSSNIY
ncbi:hypothetical protein PC123_g3451 [Phytophthora cactorum]|nr:hypothetical protein PC123_g3451 [Phytophthora cactorum]